MKCKTIPQWPCNKSSGSSLYYSPVQQRVQSVPTCLYTVELEIWNSKTLLEQNLKPLSWSYTHNLKSSFEEYLDLSAVFFSKWTTPLHSVMYLRECLFSSVSAGSRERYRTLSSPRYLFSSCWAHSLISFPSLSSDWVLVYGTWTDVTYVNSKPGP